MIIPAPSILSSYKILYVNQNFILSVHMCVLAPSLVKQNVLGVTCQIPFFLNFNLLWIQCLSATFTKIFCTFFLNLFAIKLCSKQKYNYVVPPCKQMNCVLLQKLRYTARTFIAYNFPSGSLFAVFSTSILFSILDVCWLPLSRCGRTCLDGLRRDQTTFCIFDKFDYSFFKLNASPH